MLERFYPGIRTLPMVLVVFACAALQALRPTLLVAEFSAEELLTAFKSPDWQIRANGRRLLRAIKPEDTAAVPVLLELLQIPEATHAAMDVLPIVDPAGKNSLVVLKGFLKDQNKYTRGQACETLGRIGTEEAVQALATCLEDESWEVRLAAVNALQPLGQKAAPALKALIEVLGDQEKWIWINSVDALLNIGGGEALAAIRKDVPRLKWGAVHPEGQIRKISLKALHELGVDGGAPILPSAEAIAARRKADAARLNGAVKQLYLSTCTKGNASDCYSLALIFESEANPSEAARYYKLSCDHGHADGCKKTSK